MTNRINKRKALLLFAVTLVFAAIVSAVVIGAKRSRATNQHHKRVVELPVAVSHVPKLEIVSIAVKDSGTPAATAVIEIRNNSDLAVMAVEISTKNGGDSAAVNQDGLENPDDPKMVIPPRGSTILEMSFGEMVADAPLVVSAAVFGDGSEDGDKWSLDAMRGVRMRRQELRKGQGTTKIRSKENEHPRGLSKLAGVSVYELGFLRPRRHHRDDDPEIVAQACEKLDIARLRDIVAIINWLPAAHISGCLR